MEWLSLKKEGQVVITLLHTCTVDEEFRVGHCNSIIL